MAGVEARCATANDLDALLGLYAELSPSNAETRRERAAAALDKTLKMPGLSLVVALKDGEVAATATLIVVPNLTHDGRPWAQLENMVVAECARRSGVGTALLRHCIELAWDEGCYKVQLQSDNAREGAHAFYEANGFVASSKGYRLYR